MISLRRGSIIARSAAQYNYPNNQSQIDFLNNNLNSSLEKIFHESELLKNISEALEASVEIQDIVMLRAEIESK